MRIVRVLVKISIQGTFLLTLSGFIVMIARGNMAITSHQLKKFRRKSSHFGRLWRLVLLFSLSVPVTICPFTIQLFFGENAPVK